MKPHRPILLVTLALVVTADQLTKSWVRAELPLGARRTLVPAFLDLRHVENRGAAFGLLSGNDHRMVFFAIVAMLSFAVLLGLLRRLAPERRGRALALSLIFSGAVGNFLDRLMYRAVTDLFEIVLGGAIGEWLLRTLGSNRWPVFNVADLAVVLGALLFVLSTAVEPEPGEEPR